MKYFGICFSIMSMLMTSCQTETKNIPPKDSSQTEISSAARTTADNLVNAEAPDAMTKTEQGYALPRYDGGKGQSPINILSDSTVKDSGKMIDIKFNAGITAVENLGHTIQVDFNDGSTTLADGKTYQTKQFHFHTPSEHMIDGITYPMEMHIVNVLKDSNAKGNPQYLVIGLLFKMGHENKFIKEFLNAIPPDEKKDSLPGTVVFEDLFIPIPKNESRAYYFYKGSLTTPPFSETVSWMIRKYILEASPEQIYTIEKMEGNNARHIQALYTRKVLNH
jgi:carbonic anhydrase